MGLKVIFILKQLIRLRIPAFRVIVGAPPVYTFCGRDGPFQKIFKRCSFQFFPGARPFYCDYNPIPEKKKHGK